MHTLIKSEAYYLINDPVIRHWENRVTLRKCAESLRIRLRCTGRANTNILDLTMQDNSVIISIITCGKTFRLSMDVCENLEDVLSIQDDNKQLQKYLMKMGGIIA